VSLLLLLLLVLVLDTGILANEVHCSPRRDATGL
jgi:hypothetical protein